jgi:hypothetical protein
MNLGIIKISDTMMDQLNVDKDVDVFKLLYSKFYPKAIFYDQFRQQYEMLGYCDEFTETKEGCEYPKYAVMITSHEGGSLTIKFNPDAK